MPDPDRFDEAAFADLHMIRVRTADIRALEDDLRVLVIRLRGRFVPWDDIAAELGVTRQAAQQRYGKYCRA